MRGEDGWRQKRQKAPKAGSRLSSEQRFGFVHDVCNRSSMMMAAEGNNNIVRYIYRGEEGERIPRRVTHVYVENLAAVRARAFQHRPNIQEVICHAGVERIEEYAFYWCPSLRRVIIPGVKEVEKKAFGSCFALTYIECGKLEIIGEAAFNGCRSLRNTSLPSIRIVQSSAFGGCKSLTNAKLGKGLESIRRSAFNNCTSLERIALPLKDRMIIDDRIFNKCLKLSHIDLVEGALLHETVASLLMEKWKKDMNEEIDSINRILRNTHSGNDYNIVGGKAREIRAWIESVHRKIIKYKGEHQHTLSVAAETLQTALTNDIVFKNVLPFVELPSYTFEGEI